MCVLGWLDSNADGDEEVEEEGSAWDERHSGDKVGLLVGVRYVVRA